MTPLQRKILELLAGGGDMRTAQAASPNAWMPIGALRAYGLIDDTSITEKGRAWLRRSDELKAKRKRLASSTSAERAERALKAREQGMTYREIGTLLGLSGNRARQLVLSGARLRRREERKRSRIATQAAT
jgi:hypothetical protein